jgi:cyclopropane-fatty-acyl-phospholipid synthase
MSVTQTQTADPAVQISSAFLRDLLAGYGPRDFVVRFWDGSTWEADAGQPTRFTWVLRHPGSLRSAFWPPTRLAFYEAFLYNDYDVEGDLESFWAIGKYLNERRRGLAEKLRAAARLFRLPSQRPPRTGRQPARLRGRRHSLERDRQAVSYHYDVSNDFFALFLDPQMVYTCAYFATPDDDLEAAQTRKLETVCQKLRLKPGERLLDVGCGWGALLIHAARHHGAEAVGITLSKPQAELARERIRQAGLEGRCRVEMLDYREVTGPFDKIASIEMYEQVGAEMMPVYFRRMAELLRPGGLFLNQGIVLDPTYGVPRVNFGNLYVFPDGALVQLSTALRAAEQAGLEARDVESLREHYVLTLRHWVRRLEARADEARRLTDAVAFRVWRLYMTLSAFGFRNARLNDYQVLFCKPGPGGASGLPLTRSDLLT